MKIKQKIILVIGYNRFLVPDDWTYEDIEKYCQKKLALISCDYSGTSFYPFSQEKIEIVITTSCSDADADADANVDNNSKTLDKEK
jgi:signal recognition particle receptor subunit beta